MSEPPPSKSRALPLFGALLVGLLVSAAAALSLGEDDNPVSPPAPAPAPVGAPIEAEPLAPELPPLPSEAQADTVVLRFKTNVPVRVLEARDEAMFARGALIDEVELPRSDVPLELILRADGYRDHALFVVPNRDQLLRINLEPKPKSTQPAPKSEPAQAEPASPEHAPKPTDNSFAPEIVNPWEATKRPD